MTDTGRLEAFSDGVMAIIITIMVLELSTPHGTDFSALRPLLLKFLSYILSFIYVGIYWNNHHHLFQIAKRVSGGVLWANLHLLFWLSLIPFGTAWMGDSNFATIPTAIYGGILLLAAVAWWILLQTILASEESTSLLKQAVGSKVKEILSILFYVVAIILSFVRPWMAGVLYAVVALMWIIPDRRLEKTLVTTQEKDNSIQSE